MFVPIIFIITVLLSSILLWFVYKKIKRGIDISVKKGAEIASDQQQKWAEKSQRKKFPTIVQKGFDDHAKIQLLTDSLPDNWKTLIDPLVNLSKEILDEIAFEFDNNPSSLSKKNISTQNKKLNSIRPFFIHSLDALLQFVEKLDSDHKKMNADEINKAHQNINVFKADLLNHQETLHKVRRFDFDVVMDVIKARLKR